MMFHCLLLTPFITKISPVGNYWYSDGASASGSFPKVQTIIRLSKHNKMRLLSDWQPRVIRLDALEWKDSQLAKSNCFCWDTVTSLVSITNKYYQDVFVSCLHNQAGDRRSPRCFSLFTPASSFVSKFSEWHRMAYEPNGGQSTQLTRLWHSTIHSAGESSLMHVCFKSKCGRDQKHM